MQELYQKFHGLPGIGVSGLEGKKGKKGTGVYIGFVNDFFNTNSIDVDTIVRVARQISDPSSGFTGSYFVSDNTAIVDAHFINNRYLEFTSLTDVMINSKEGRKEYYDIYQMGHGANKEDKTKWDWRDDIEEYVSPTRVIVDMTHIPYDYDSNDYDDEAILSGSGLSKGISVLYSTKLGEPKYFLTEPQSAYLTAEQIVPDQYPSESIFDYDSSYIKTAITATIGNEDIENKVFFDLSTRLQYIVPAEAETEQYTNYVSRYTDIFSAFYNMASRKYPNLNDEGKLVPEDDEDFYVNPPQKTLNYVLWEEKNAKAVAVPTTLKDEFVEGDILYVYTNKQAFNLGNYKIDYMINVTKDMIGANYAYVLSNAIAQNPFAFAEFTLSNDKVVLNNDLNLIAYDASDNDKVLMDRMKSQFVENYNEQLDFNEYIIEISEFRENEQDCKFIDLRDETKELMNIHSENASTFNIDASFNDVSSLKLSSLFISDKTKTPELYTRNLLLPPFINFTNEGFLPALKEESYNDSNATFRINKSDYILDSPTTLEMNYNYGVIVINNSNGECKEIINPANGTIYLDVSFYGSTRQRYVEDSSYNFSIIPFIDPEGCMRYFARTTEISIIVDASGNVSRSINSASETYNTDVNWQNTNDIDFTLRGNIGVEATSEADLLISFLDASIDTTNVSIYANGKDNINTGATTQNYEWIQIEHVEPEGDKLKIHIHDISSNLPNIDGQNPETVEDYMTLPIFTDNIEGPDVSISNLFKMIRDKQLISTLSRSVLITVIYKFTYETEADEPHKAFYWITQPGFTDPRVLPSVDFKNHVEQIELEECNSNENGVLGNQFQYFIDISINGFSSEEWAKYTKDITVDLELTSMNESFNMMTAYNYSAVHDYANVKQVFESENDLGDDINTFFTNIYIQTGDVKTNDTIASLEENASNSFVEDLENLDEDTFGWTIDSSYFADKDKKKPLEIESFNNIKYVRINSSMYVADEFACKFDTGVFNPTKLTLKNIPIEYLQSKDKQLKIRVLFEQSNPVLTKLEYNFVVTNMVINYSGTKFYFDDVYTKVDAEHNAPFGFLYDLYIDQLSGFDVPKFMSGEQEFYIRPISYIAAPINAETSTGLRYSAVKISGSDDNIKVGLEMYCQNYFDRLVNNPIGTSERSRLYKSAFEWSNAILKKRYLQDDIASIDILSNDPYEMIDKISKNNSFIQILNSFDDNFAPDVSIATEAQESDDFITQYADKSSSAILNANEQEYPIFRNFGRLDNIYNIFGTDAPYLAVTYRTDFLHPKLRDDKNTFYYNDKLYETERYSQYENNSPAFITADTSSMQRTQSLLDSMDVWNFEYQHSGYASYKNTYLGKVSIYSTGYEYLNADADEGQYGEDSSTLAEVRAANEELVLNTIDTKVLPVSKLKDRYPKEKEAFRSILYALRWQYPVFVSANTYYGFDVVSPFMSLVDYEYLSTAYNHNEENFSTDMTLYGQTLDEINQSFNESYPKDAEAYMKLKTQECTKDPEKMIFHNMIPYNILYNVYPRIAYNDEKKSIDVLMLRRPSICDRNKTKLEKHYFDMSEYPECEQPYNIL